MTRTSTEQARQFSSLNAQQDTLEQDTFGQDILAGLGAAHKKISAKYFYDDHGSRLFQKITQHPDYYPTRTEYSVLENLKDQLPTIIDEQEIDIIELGAGDGHKTQLILDGFLDAGYQVHYYPIDISEKAMEMLESTITPHDKLVIDGIIAEYELGIQLARAKSNHTQLVLFLGSNIGNFEPVQCQSFLKNIHSSLNQSDFLLLGADLKKEASILTAAYNDSAGYTREFNLNVLRRINRELDANFDIDRFEHLGIYNPKIGAMESYLISREAHTVNIGKYDADVAFESREAIHMEYSYKFLLSDIERLSRNSDFSVVEHFTDDKDYFVDSLWQVDAR